MKQDDWLTILKAIVIRLGMLAIMGIVFYYTRSSIVWMMLGGTACLALLMAYKTYTR